MPADYLDRLARLAAQTRFADLSLETVAAAKDVVLDTLGAMLAGSRLPENARLARLAAARSGPRTATLVGHGERAEPMLAALVNATAGVAFEVDEGNRWGGGHPAIHVLPAVLAVAEEQQADGRRLIEGLVAGYEVTSRLGGATTVRPNVHSHGTWGTIGAAVAVTRLLGRDTPAIRQVINLAASMSPANSWAPCFEGATIRNLYPGRAALQGILAAHLLDCGYGAPHDAPSDVFGTILGERFEPERALDDLGADEDRPAVYRIQRNYVKLHACCLYNHPALDAIQALLSRQPLEPETIAGITVTSVPFVTRMREADPRNMLAAKFSVPYAVAAAVITGESGVAAFLDATRTDPRVRELAGRVEVRGEPAMSMRAAGPTAHVTVRLRDGRVLTHTATVIRGDAANAVPRVELVAKFRALAGDVLGATGVERVIGTVDRLPELKDVRDLTEMLWTTS